MCTNSGEPVQNQLMMRILGAICLILGVIEIIIGFIIYVFLTNLHVGGWWGAILTVVSGSLAISSASRGVVTGACITGSIGVVLAVIAAIVDGIASAVVKSFTGCCNGAGDCWGSSEGKACAAYCYQDFYSSNTDSSSCVCSDGSSLGSSFTCWHYTLSSGSNCNAILTTYSNELSTSTAFLSFGAITLLVLSITTCSALCCAKPTVVNVVANPTATNAATQPVVVVSPIATQPVAGQPQVAYVVEPTKY